MKNMKPKLPKKPNSITLNLLCRAKLFLAHALSHSNSFSSLDRMIAIHGLDNSIEYLLRIIIKHLDIESITGKNLETPELSALAGEVNQFLHSNYNSYLPYFSEIKLIRQVRNLVQHGMVDPKPDLKRCSTVTERFFDKMLETIFGINREGLRISTLIENDVVMKHLYLAEKYLDSKKYLKSVVASRDAFENALFFQAKNSNIKFSAAPALVETMKTRQHAYWFLSIITDEFELSRLGVDSKRHNRFSEYLRHIPGEYRADKSGGWVIMQRPWNKEDALFCYSFVADIVMKWQSEEMQPIYIPRIDTNYSWKTKLGKVDISNQLEGGCIYSFGFDFGEEMQLIYVDYKLKKKLDNLVPENEYLYNSEFYKEGKLVNRVEYKVKLLSINKKLVINNPETWEIMFWFKYIPFTWHKEQYKDGELIEKSPCINTATIEELVKINDTIIKRSLAGKIVSLRKAIGEISSKNDLKKVNNITDEQISWLVRFTKI